MQFTHTYIAGDLDGNVDLTGIINNGYTANDQLATNISAIEETNYIKSTKN